MENNMTITEGLIVLHERKSKITKIFQDKEVKIKQFLANDKTLQDENILKLSDEWINQMKYLESEKNRIIDSILQAFKQPFVTKQVDINNLKNLLDLVTANSKFISRAYFKRMLAPLLSDFETLTFISDLMNLKPETVKFSQVIKEDEQYSKFYEEYEVYRVSSELKKWSNFEKSKYNDPFTKTSAQEVLTYMGRVEQLNKLFDGLGVSQVKTNLIPENKYIESINKKLSEVLAVSI